jgi:hypothetical protein
MKFKLKGLVMEIRDIWNDMCFHIKDKDQNASERDFQTIAESLFEKLGWSPYKGEIVTQETIRVGANNSIKPDMVIKNKGQTLFVVELKKPNKTLIEKYAEQLISYMRLLKLNFGILLGETLQVYYELPNDNKPPVKIREISFVEDLDEGINLIKLLSKNEYTPEKLQRYCEDLLIDNEKKEKSKEYIIKLCSKEGTEIIIGLLKEKLSTEFSEEIITSIINEIDIHISMKIKNSFSPAQHQTGGPSPPPPNELTPSKAKKLCRENGFDLNGEVTFASKNVTSATYWANPNIQFLAADWWLLLNDYRHHNLHIFYIPANSIEKDQIKTRADNSDKIDLQIKYEDDLFEDSRSGVQFVIWYRKTISY